MKRFMNPLHLALALWIPIAVSIRAEDGQYLKLVSSLGGGNSAIALNGRYAYASEGRSIITIDLNDEGGPREVARICASIPNDFMNKTIRQFLCNGRTLVALLDGGFATLDLADPSRPVWGAAIYGVSGGSYPTIDTTHFLLPGDPPYDITDPYHPTAVPGLESQVTDALVADRFATLTSGPNDLITLNLRDLSGSASDLTYDLPAEAGHASVVLMTGSPGCSTFFVLCVFLNSGPVTTILYAMEAKDGEITLNASRQDSTYFFIAATEGNRVCLVEPSYAGVGSPLRAKTYGIFELTQDSVLSELARFPVAADANTTLIDALAATALSGELIADVDRNRGIRIRDWTLPGAAPPFYTAPPAAPLQLADMVLSQGTLYGAESSGLKAFSADAETGLARLGSWSLPRSDSSVSLSVRGEVAALSTSDAAYFLNIAQPSSPTLLGSATSAGLPGGMLQFTRWISPSETMILRGGPCVAAPPFYSSLCSVRFVDATDPVNPVAQSRPYKEEDGGGTVTALDASSGYVYVGTEHSLRVRSADPSLTLLGAVEVPSPVLAIMVDRGRAYIATQQSLLVYDLSVPTSPTLSGACALPDSIVVDDRMRIGVSEDTVYVTGGVTRYGPANLYAVDVSNPVLPRLVDTLPFDSEGAVSIAAEGDLLAFSTGTGELLLYQNSFGAHREIIDRILGRAPSASEFDLNGDGVVDVADAVLERLQL